METKEILIEARNLIADPNNWTTDVHARRADGQEVFPISSDACQWCADGALLKVLNFGGPAGSVARPPVPGGYTEATEALNRTAAELYGEPDLVELNDHANHEAVIGMFDEAIASFA